MLSIRLGRETPLVSVRPETLLRWHRQGLRLLWTWRSRSKSRPSSRLAAELIALTGRMAAENRLWGAERIRGELLKLGYTAAKSTIQRYMSRIRGIAPDGQRWSTFLRNLRLVRGARPLVNRADVSADLLALLRVLWVTIVDDADEAGRLRRSQCVTRAAASSAHPTSRTVRLS
ncbi:MAG: Integrase, catalytic region [Ramlibacter sp.]|nr:Integrase, catalytic region [Ramlibacter sp.]